MAKTMPKLREASRTAKTTLQTDVFTQSQRITQSLSRAHSPASKAAVLAIEALAQPRQLVKNSECNDPRSGVVDLQLRASSLMAD